MVWKTDWTSAADLRVISIEVESILHKFLKHAKQANANNNKHKATWSFIADSNSKMLEMRKTSQEPNLLGKRRKGYTVQALRVVLFCVINTLASLALRNVEVLGRRPRHVKKNCTKTADSCAVKKKHVESHLREMCHVCSWKLTVH